jgi:putative copper resistance protein D
VSPAARLASLVAGSAAATLALAVHPESLPAHMAEHVVLTSVAAPLIVLGRPVTLLLRLAGAPRRDVVAVLRSRAVRLLARPALAWTLFVVVQWAFHLPPLFDLALERPALHALEHLLFLGTGILFWEVAIGGDPVPYRLTGPAQTLYLLLAIPANDLITARYMVVGETTAGAVMGAGMVPLALAVCVVTWSWLRREERRARRWEAYVDAAR